MNMSKRRPLSRCRRVPKIMKRGKNMKRLIATVLALALLLCAAAMLGGCGKDGNNGTSDNADVTMALVVAGKFGDRSFYDSSKEGADRLTYDLGV